MRNRIRTGACAALLCVAVTAMGTATAIADVEAPPSGITVGGRTYGPEAGVRSESGSVIIDGPGVSIMATTKYTKGTSWVSNNHPDDFTYIGSANSAANVIGDVRYIASKYKYTRGTTQVSGGWVSANAYVNAGCAWQPAFVSRSYADSLDPNAPQTKFNYDFVSISKNIC